MRSVDLIRGGSDRLAISLSLLCAIHCLAVPLLVIYLPTLALPALTGEALHLWLMAVVIPVSTFAMVLGCKQHQRYRLGMIVGIGLSVLFISAIFGHDWLGETGERLMTLAGSTIIAFGHFRNFKLCQTEKSCGCSDSEKAAV